MTTSTKLQPQATGRNQPPPDEAPALPLLLRIKDVMRELAVSRRTVYELVKDGKLHLVRVGISNPSVRVSATFSRRTAISAFNLRIALSRWSSRSYRPLNRRPPF